MHATWLIYLAIFSDTWPALAGLSSRARQGPRIWIVLFSLLLTLNTALEYSLGRQSINNHFLTYLWKPVQGAVLLWALSLWQTRPEARLTIRIMIPLFVTAWFALSAFENRNNFSTMAYPVYALLVLATLAYTLITRSGDATEPITRQDWFWVCIGLALSFGSSGAYQPLAAAFVRTRPDLIIRAQNVRAIINLFAFAGITYGLLCPTQPASSGISSSPPS